MKSSRPIIDFAISVSNHFLTLQMKIEMKRIIFKIIFTARSASGEIKIDDSRGIGQLLNNDPPNLK